MRWGKPFRTKEVVCRCTRLILPGMFGSLFSKVPYDNVR